MLTLLRAGLLFELAVRIVERGFARLSFADHLVAAAPPGLRRAFVRTLLDTVRGRLARRELPRGPVTRWVASLLVAAVLLPRRAAAFRRRHGFAPPGFLVVTATDRCNYECSHCYAGSSTRQHRSLDRGAFSRLLDEQRAEWGASLVIVTGGEPFLYRDGEHDLLSLARQHPCTLFVVYTNGSPINEAVAARLAELGNVAPLVSLEGDEAMTAAVRGPRAHGAALQAMRHLRSHGVPFGVSVTAGRSNAALLADAGFFRRLRDEHGATFFWILERASMGRGEALNADLLSVEGRRRLQAALGALVADGGLLVVSHLHTLAARSGCMGAGRVDGFFHIESNGDIKHCVYSRLRLDNVHAIHRRGEPLSSFLLSPWAAAIREAQAAFFSAGRDGGPQCGCPALLAETPHP